MLTLLIFENQLSQFRKFHRMKEIKRTTITKDSEKAFDKIQHIFMTKKRLYSWKQLINCGPKTVQLILVIKWEYIAQSCRHLFALHLWLFFGSIVSFVVETEIDNGAKKQPEIICFSLFDIRPLVQFATLLVWWLTLKFKQDFLRAGCHKVLIIELNSVFLHLSK